MWIPIIIGAGIIGYLLIRKSTSNQSPMFSDTLSSEQFHNLQIAPKEYRVNLHSGDNGDIHLKFGDRVAAFLPAQAPNGFR